MRRWILAYPHGKRTFTHRRKARLQSCVYYAFLRRTSERTIKHAYMHTRLRRLQESERNGTLRMREFWGRVNSETDDIDQAVFAQRKRLAELRAQLPIAM